MNSTRSRQPTPPATASISSPGAVAPADARGVVEPRNVWHPSAAGGLPAAPGVVVLAVDAASDPPPLHAVSIRRASAASTVAGRRHCSTESQGRRPVSTDGSARARAVRSSTHGNARRTARVRARREAADRQLRRPRPHALCQRRRLRGAAARGGHERVAHGAVPVGTRRGCAVPRRGRRRAPHTQCRARHLPVGAHHPRTEPARRRWRVPPHRRRRLGPRRRRRSAPGVPRPDRTGHRVGLRREPPRQPSRHARTAARSSSTSTSSSPSSSRSPCASATKPPSGSRASRSGGSRPKKARCSPIEWSRTHRDRPGGSSGSCSTSRPASPRSRCIPAPTPTSSGPRAVTGPGRVEDYVYLTRDASLLDLLERAHVTLIGWRQLRELQRG